MNDTARILMAAERVCQWHDGQRRKGAAQEPYMIHLLHVAQLVAEATDGNDTNLVIAALCHDAIEDAEVSRDTLSTLFGQDVAELVTELSDDKSLAKDVRKQLQIENAPQKSPRAALLTMADKISNVMSLANSPPQDWSKERLMEYVEWANAVVARLPVLDPVLSAKFAEACEVTRGRLHS